MNEEDETLKAMALMVLFIAALFMPLPVDSIYENGHFKMWFVGYSATVITSLVFLYLIGRCRRNY